VIRKISMVLIGVGVFLAISLPLRAQKASGAPLTDNQKDGRRIFQQRCAVCHTLPTLVSKRYGPALYKEIVEDNDDNIRDAIMEGREGLMPGFKYGLTRAEIDSIVEYLKTVTRPARPKSNPNQSEGTPASAGE
jgi:mono/diheme cytochrome c family protein